jgi:AbrB family looped-hinge helix DNA binding protein
MTLQINITPNGRMSLPADVRKRLGLTGGGAVYLDETEDGVVLRTASQAVARAVIPTPRWTHSYNGVVRTAANERGSRRLGSHCDDQG